MKIPKAMLKQDYGEKSIPDASVIPIVIRVKWADNMKNSIKIIGSRNLVCLYNLYWIKLSEKGKETPWFIF